MSKLLWIKYPLTLPFFQSTTEPSSSSVRLVKTVDRVSHPRKRSGFAGRACLLDCGRKGNVRSWELTNFPFLLVLTSRVLRRTQEK